MGRRDRAARLGVSEVEYLVMEDLLGLVRALRAGPVRDLGLLDAACARPQSMAFGQDVYPTLEQKAAALFHSIVRTHALVDGNKRLGWLATTVFLDLHGHAVSLTDDEAFQLVMEVAQGELEVDQIADRLGRH